MDIYRANGVVTIQPWTLIGLDETQVAPRRHMIEPEGDLWRTRQCVQFKRGERVSFDGAAVISKAEPGAWTLDSEGPRSRGRPRKSPPQAQAPEQASPEA